MSNTSFHGFRGASLDIEPRNVRCKSTRFLYGSGLLLVELQRADKAERASMHPWSIAGQMHAFSGVYVLGP